MDKMVRCPACMGEGGHDMRDTDAYLEEHLPDDALAVAKAVCVGPWGGVVECATCDGTGRVPDSVARDIHAASVAFIDQVKARAAEQGLIL